MKRLSLVLLAALLAGSALLVGSARASNAASCGNKVISDWYDNGRIDRTYPVECYTQALRILPLDVKEYADAAEVITSARTIAIAAAAKRHVNPNSGTDTTETGTTPTTTGPGGSVPPPGKGGGTPPPGAETKGPDPILTKALNRLGPSNADSIPLPLVVLGALALLLLAAGAAGMVARKLQERRLPITPAGTPPPDAT